MATTTVLLVDQSSIAASFDCVSLFVNGKHILDVDDSGDAPIDEIAESIASALDTVLDKQSLSELELAKYIAHTRNESSAIDAQIKEGVNDFDDWVQGYNNNDVLGAIAFHGKTKGGATS